MSARRVIGAALAAFLAGCAAVGPDYHVPAEALINTAAAGRPFAGAELAAVSADEPPGQWWRLYQDPLLDRLIAEALTANADLRVAAANIARSDAWAMEADGAKELRAGVSATAVRARESGEAYLRETPIPVETLADVGIRMSYQLDLVGGLRRAAEAAHADAGASRAALDVARISVVAEVVQAYTEACAAGYELDVAQRRLDLLREHRAVTTRLVAAGRGTTVELPREHARVEQSLAALPMYTARRRLALYRVAVLSGHVPAEFPPELASCTRLPQLQQPIPVGDGAALLRRRPDVRQAEFALAGASARVGVATAALYPSVSLGLAAGVTGILDHLGQPQTQRWNLGPLISWTLPGAREKARVREADAGSAAALAHFDAVVLHALQEVDGALALLAADLDRHAALRRAQEQAAAASHQTRQLARAGRLPYVDELDARRGELDADAAVAASASRLAGDQIRLFLALGGGWG
jgi:NodT family efflux transporter outer membrane factor (OMF) lipoprotein